MFRKDDPILLIADDEEELGEHKMHLDIGYTRIYATTDQEAGAQLFEQKKPAVLMLSFEQLGEAEEFYLELFHHCENIYEIPHHTIILVTRHDLERAYDLCRREIFNDFVITRPLMSEQRLRLAVAQGLEKRALRLGIQHGQILLKKLANQIDQMKNEFQRVMSKSHQYQRMRNESNKQLLHSIDHRLTMFRDSLMGPSMHAIVNVMDADALRGHFDRMQQEEVLVSLEQHHGKMDEALSAWTDNLEEHLQLLDKAAAVTKEKEENYAPQILVIDDDSMQRDVLSAVLGKAGYDVHLAPSGVEGLGQLINDIPDLVLLDYEMPGLDGISVLKKARQIPELQDLPIVMLTGHSEKDVVRACLGAGASDYLVKPVKRENLLERVSHFAPLEDG